MLSLFSKREQKGKRKKNKRCVHRHTHTNTHGVLISKPFPSSCTMVGENKDIYCLFVLLILTIWDIRMSITFDNIFSIIFINCIYFSLPQCLS